MLGIYGNYKKATPTNSISIASLREEYECAKIDSDLHKLMLDDSCRQKLETLLVDKYLQFGDNEIVNIKLDREALAQRQWIYLKSSFKMDSASRSKVDEYLKSCQDKLKFKRLNNLIMACFWKSVSRDVELIEECRWEDLEKSFYCDFQSHQKGKLLYVSTDDVSYCDYLSQSIFNESAEVVIDYDESDPIKVKNVRDVAKRIAMSIEGERNKKTIQRKYERAREEAAERKRREKEQEEIRRNQILQEAKTREEERIQREETERRRLSMINERKRRIEEKQDRKRINVIKNTNAYSYTVTESKVTILKTSYNYAEPLCTISLYSDMGQLLSRDYATIVGSFTSKKGLRLELLVNGIVKLYSDEGHYLFDMT